MQVLYVGDLLYSQSWLSKVAATFSIEQNQADKVSFNHIVICILTQNIANKRRRRWHPTPVLLPGKSHGRRSLVGYSPWGLEESDTTERLHFYFSLSCIGEGNGNPLQCSCLESPRDMGGWVAAEVVLVGCRLWSHTESDTTEVT